MKKSKLLIILCTMFIVTLAACGREMPYVPAASETALPPVLISAAAEPAAAPPVATAAEPIITHPVISLRDMPHTMQPPRDTSGKELVEYSTLEVEANIFFETTASIRSAILAEGGTLYFGNEDNMFYAVDISTGQILWTFSIDDAVQTLPALTNGKIIFNVGNSLYILNASTGEQIHIVTHPTNYSVRISHDESAFNDSHTAVADGVAYFAALNGDLVAVDIISGEIIWTLEAIVSGLVTSGVSYYNGMLYFIGFPGHFFGVCAQTGQIMFETRIRNLAFNPMTIYDGRIYIGGRNMRFYSIDAQTGEVIWNSHSRSLSTWFSGGSVIIGNTVFAGTSDERHITAFDKNTGEFQRIYSALEFVYTPLLSHGNNVVAVTTNILAAADPDGPGMGGRNVTPKSYAMAIDTQNHTKLWIAPIDDTVLSPPAIYQNVLFFGSDSGTVYSIDLELIS